MQLPPALTWLLKCALAAALVLGVARLATVAIGNRLQQPAATARDGALISLNRYVREPVPDIVLVGSSVAWRLKEEYFATSSLRNLSLAGGTPVTGLEIVARQQRLPKVVVIETNILSRAPDDSLIAQFSGGERHGTLFLRPLRTAVAAYETWIHAPERSGAAAAQLLARPPINFDNRVYVERARQEMNAEDPSVPARASVARIRQLIDDVERRGTRAYLIEIPLAPELETTRSITLSRAIVREAFPDPNRWLVIDPPRAELRWADGMHLDERSALIVARAVETALAARANGR